MNTTILKFRAAVRPTPVARNTADLLELFALDRLPAGRRRLAAHWHRASDGQLVCSWEQELGSAPRR